MDGTHLFYVSKVAEAAIGGNAESAASYLRQFVEYLQTHGEEKEAEKLRRIVDRKPARTASLNRHQGSRIPVDSESALSIADREFVAKGTVQLVLPEHCRETVSQFIRYIHEADRLEASGVGISPTLLLYGPPGTGKTGTARYIAAEMGLPLITARSDGLISSYLGSTSKNVRRLFDFAMSEPCVLFLDEFDAVAKKRDDSRELGELKRVVISLLQNIDSLDKNHILIAATNHDHLLDPAIWRRFAYRIKLEAPDAHGRRQLLRLFFSKHLLADWDEALSRLCDGLTGAQIKNAAENAIRESVLSGRSSVDPGDAAAALLREGGQASMDRLAMIKYLRSLDERVFTQSVLGSLFSVSQPYISRVLKQD